MIEQTGIVKEVRFRLAVPHFLTAWIDEGKSTVKDEAVLDEQGIKNLYRNVVAWCQEIGKAAEMCEAASPTPKPRRPWGRSLSEYITVLKEAKKPLTATEILIAVGYKCTPSNQRKVKSAISELLLNKKIIAVPNEGAVPLFELPPSKVVIT